MTAVQKQFHTAAASGAVSSACAAPAASCRTAMLMMKDVTVVASIFSMDILLVLLHISLPGAA